jgi:riboflavin kinase/FMN adenylyltransferase
MRTWQGLETVTTPFPTSTVAIGRFDGVHRGHQALISRAVEDAHTHGRPAVVFTFDRHPAELIAPDRAPGYLSTPEQRAELIASLGADHLVVAHFDERFRELSPEAFMHFVLSGILGAKSVFVGADFRFGHDQSGDVNSLREAEERLGFKTTVLEPILVNGKKAASSDIRDLLRDGELQAALEMLGHAYTLTGRVVEGQKLGRTLGYPTANLQLEINQVVPEDGIYAVWVHYTGQRYKGACSIGMRPTVGGTERTIETFILDFNADLYGRRLDIEFMSRLRDELKFDSLEALVEQIALDVEEVRVVLSTPRTEVRG